MASGAAAEERKEAVRYRRLSRSRDEGQEQIVRLRVDRRGVRATLEQIFVTSSPPPVAALDCCSWRRIGRLPALGRSLCRVMSSPKGRVIEWLKGGNQAGFGRHDPWARFSGGGGVEAVAKAVTSDETLTEQDCPDEDTKSRRHALLGDAL